MKIGILGYGEIGKSIHKVYDHCQTDYDVYVKDVDRDDGLNYLDVLNVSIPQNDKFDFVDVVVNNVRSSHAKIVIIHSTVSIGTTRKIKDLLVDLSVVIAHSPCRGLHPNLYEGLITFEKLVGSPCIEDSIKVSLHLNDIGIVTRVCKNSETSELAKLLDTSYYGLCIAYHGEAEKACEKFGADFEDAMTFYNTTYNAGYEKLGKTNVIRPVLTPPRGGIGGHCVIQNAELLSKQFESPALDLVMRYKMDNHK